MATPLSANELLLGIGLVVVLAVGSQLFARALRLPAIVVLLPVGFVAGILTNDVRPGDLLGPLYQPFVSVAVGVILFEMLTGRLPFEYPQQQRLLTAHIKESPPRFAKMGCGDTPPGIPAGELFVRNNLFGW